MEDQMLQMTSTSNGFGKIEIAPEVIEVIAGIATSEVEGVTSMRGNFAAGVVEKLGRKNPGKGVRVELAEEGIKVDVYVLMKFGVSIPTVAQEVQDNIRQALLTMTALEVAEINIHVVGVEFEKTPKVETTEAKN